MPDLTHDDQAMRRLLQKRRIAVVGASDKPERDSYRVFVYLKDNGYDVVPVNPAADAVAGVPTVPDLAAAKQRLGHIDIVDVFRRPEHITAVVAQAKAAGADAVWLQLGVVDEEGQQAALAAGMDLVVDRCIKIEHGRLA